MRHTAYQLPYHVNTALTRPYAAYYNTPCVCRDSLMWPEYFFLFLFVVEGRATTKLKTEKQSAPVRLV